MGNEDRRRLERIKRLSPQELALDKTGFDDARLTELVWRYRARNFPTTLTPDEQQRWQQRQKAQSHENVPGMPQEDAGRRKQYWPQYTFLPDYAAQISQCFCTRPISEPPAATNSRICRASLVSCCSWRPIAARALAALRRSA